MTGFDVEAQVFELVVERHVNTPVLNRLLWLVGTLVLLGVRLLAAF